MRYTRASIQQYLNRALSGPVTFTLRTPDEARRLRFALYNATRPDRTFSVHVRGCIVECKPHASLEDLEL